MKKKSGKSEKLLQRVMLQYQYGGEKNTLAKPKKGGEKTNRLQRGRREGIRGGGPSRIANEMKLERVKKKPRKRLQDGGGGKVRGKRDDATITKRLAPRKYTGRPTLRGPKERGEQTNRKGSAQLVGQLISIGKKWKKPSLKGVRLGIIAAEDRLEEGKRTLQGATT